MMVKAVANACDSVLIVMVIIVNITYASYVIKVVNKHYVSLCSY